MAGRGGQIFRGCESKLIPFITRPMYMYEYLTGLSTSAGSVCSLFRCARLILTVNVGRLYVHNLLQWIILFIT